MFSKNGAARKQTQFPPTLPALARKPVPLTLREEQLILSLRAVKKPTILMIVVGGDGIVKVAGELGALLDLTP